MICKCPQCDGALEYSPVSDMMECPFCGTSYDMMQIMAVQNQYDHRNGNVYTPYGAENNTNTASAGNAYGGGWESNPYAQRM